MKHTIDTPDAPAAVGAYSQATTDGSLVFTAGQIPVTPEGDLLDDEPIDVQARQCLDNLEAILAASDCATGDVLKATIYLNDVEDFDAVNRAYEGYFPDDPPARSAVGVDALPKGVGVEIEAVASRT